MTFSKMRRPKPRGYRPSPFDALSDLERELLFDLELSPIDEFANYYDVDHEALWTTHRDAVLAAWIKNQPGTRPSLWWRFDAPRWSATGRHVGSAFAAELPEPRLRIGGTGVPMFELFAYVPTWPLGVPNYWHEIDETDPPRFESEASYLRRHGLFLEGEEARLTEEDFEPEVID